MFPKFFLGSQVSSSAIYPFYHMSRTESGGMEVKDNGEKTTLRSGVMYNVGEGCT